MKLMIDGIQYPFEMIDNKTTRALKDRMPFELKLSDYNRNEKVGTMSQSLQTESRVYQTIEAGDVMLYGSDAIVVFYKTFKSGYSYTRIGKIESDVSELDHRGAVRVKFEI